MRVQPINCFRPVPERAGRFSAPPYDVLDDEAARVYVAEHPESFMEVARPETAFPPGQDPYAPEVYAHALKLLQTRAGDGTLLREERPCLYAYRMASEGRSQMGVVCAVAVDDYLDGTLRRHELTREEKVLDRMSHIEATGAQCGPALIAYPDEPAIDLLLGLACTAEPLYDFEAEDGVRHTVWRVAREAAVEAICATFAHVDHGYVADGHHRAAAAVRLCEEARARGEKGPRDAFLAILYPVSQMRLLAYNRVVADSCGLDEAGLVGALEAAGVACGPRGETPVEPVAPHELGMYAFGAWRRLSVAGLDAGESDPVAGLDVSLLQRHVLAPILGIEDPTRDARISFVSGAEGMGALERAAGERGVAFSLAPTTMEELMAVSDAGELMPPKSTWFAPKPRSGLFLRRVPCYNSSDLS